MKFRTLQSLGIWGLWVALWAPCFAHSQAIVAKGNGLPMNIEAGHWYLDTVGHYVWYRKGNADWEMLEGEEMVGIESCMKWVIIRSTSRFQPTLAIYGKPGPSGWVDNTTDCLCTDSVLWSWSNWDVRAFGKRDRIELPVVMRRMDACTGKADTVQGMLAFCLAANETGDRLDFPCEDMRSWGMLGLNQKWLIEPKFDAPFHFQNGIAEVSYYGKPRRIDENGDFVD